MSEELPDELRNEPIAYRPPSQQAVNEPASELVPVTTKPTMGQLALGSALLLGDTVATRLDDAQPTIEVHQRSRESVLRPVAEWENTATPLEQSRYVIIGFSKDFRQQAGRSGNSLYQASDAAGRAIDRATRPIRHSRMLKPVRNRFHRYQDTGEKYFARWSELGQQEEIRSRALAEATLGSFVQQSVTELTENQQIQVLVQQVVASQSVSIFAVILEEIRERMVSLDILLERRIGWKSRRPSSEEIPDPPFQHEYIDSRPTLAQIPHVKRTMAGQYAGLFSRFFAFLTDVIILILALSLSTTFINAFINLFNLKSFLDQFFVGDTALATFTAAIAALAGTLFVVSYGLLFWSLGGQTIGDLLFGVRVVRSDGSRLSFGRALLRMIGAYISGIALFLGFFWALFDSQHQGWHDSLAGSVVIYDWPAVPDELFLREQLAVSGVLPHQIPKS